MKDFRQELYENGYFRQEELCFADCDRYQRARVSGLLNKAAAYAGYDYNARGLTHDVLFEMGEVFLLSRIALRIHRCPRGGAGHRHLRKRGQGRPHAAGLRDEGSDR